MSGRVKLTREQAIAGLQALHAILTPNERVLMDEMAGNGRLLEDVVTELDLTFEEGLATFRSALNKASILSNRRLAN